MATCWRWFRRSRLQAPSSISKRNRNYLVYVIVFYLLLMTILLIPGGEIANYKFSGESVKEMYVTTFRRHGDDSSQVARSTRSLPNTTILLWTGFFESRTWRVADSAFQTCAVSNCDLTTDRTKVEEAAAVLFNARSLHDLSELPAHPQWQVWILHNSEPPYNIFVDLRRYSNVFNWTSWYRTDADIFSPYGYYVATGANYYYDYDDNDKPSSSIISTDKEETGSAGDQQKPETNGTDDSEWDVYRLHDRVIYYASSNCRDPARRYKKVTQLKKFLPVDEFGDCGTYQCSKGEEQCDHIFARYQFVLAFENGYCRDYVTEKLWNAYRRLQIPIVSGGVDYEQFAIPGSYIDFDNFSSVEELSEYVHGVSTDPDLYNSYFTWRKHFDVVEAPVANWCQICEALQDKNREPQVYTNLEGWVAEDTCPLYTYYQHFWTHIYMVIFRMFGI